jgi:hypothetical protein
VGKAIGARKCALDGVPTEDLAVLKSLIVDGWWARRKSAFAHPALSAASLPGLTRQSILFERLLRRWMDTRVKPAYDDLVQPK